MTRFTATVDQHHLACHGANHRDQAVMGHCDDCGRKVAKIQKNGRTYLADVFHTGIWDTPTYYCFSFHTCDPEQVERYAAAKAVTLASGAIVKGQTVEVFKGRKVPVGTVGVVFWTGTDSYDKPRVGIRTADGESHFTAESNVRFASTEA